MAYRRARGRPTNRPDGARACECAERIISGLLPCQDRHL